MNTITIQHADKKVTSVFKQMAEALGVSFEAKKEKEVKYSPEFIRRIEEYRAGKAKFMKFDEEALRKMINEG